MSPEDTYNNTQQDQGDKTPKYSSPRSVAAAIDGRFFGFFTHYVIANSISSISIGSSASARELFTHFDIRHPRTTLYSSANLIS
jgi:hypothetical protein